MTKTLLPLPIGVQTFEIIRQDNLLYVDKTSRLEELARREKEAEAIVMICKGFHRGNAIMDCILQIGRAHV